MPEYIEREMALRHKRKMSGADFGGEFWDEAVLCDDIRKIPAADVIEVRHGEWVKKEDGYCVCSECGRTRPYSNYAHAIENWVCNYCHWCGAKMDGKDDK